MKSHDKIGGVILVGYDIEARHSYGDPISTPTFLNRVVDVHDSQGISCTAFVLGQTLAENVKAFEKIVQNNLWDIEQHTFSHIYFRDDEPSVDREKAVKGVSLRLFNMRSA